MPSEEIRDKDIYESYGIRMPETYTPEKYKRAIPEDDWDKWHDSCLSQKPWNW